MVEVAQAEGESRRLLERVGECAGVVRGAPIFEVQAECRAAEPRGLEARSKGNGWRRQQVDRARVLRVLRELKWWYETRGRVWRGGGSLEEASTAEQLKELLVAHCPDTESGLAIQEESEHDLLWDRLQLVVARVRGRREHFVTASSADGVWELLRLRVPPKLQTKEERAAHDQRQATY